MEINRIGVLTSGGDAPGMNAAVRAIVRAGLAAGKEMFVVYDGYKGLVENKIMQVDRLFVSEIITRGGTIIHSARLPEFKDPEVRKIAVKNLKERGIDALVVIGGDGSYMGAKALTEMGINCIGLPGTIDNDIASTDFTIGFDTCLNTICEAVDKLRDTSFSHHRCSVIEVMGRYCGDLAIYAGIGCGADLIISSDHPLSKDKAIEQIRKMHESGRMHIIVIITEHICDVHEFAKEIEEKAGIEARAEVLGRIQRGGSPSARDRVLAAEMGVKAIDLLCEGKGGRCVGLRGQELVDYDIMEALSMNRAPQKELLDVIYKLR